MDREELSAIVSEGPVRIRMNDGRSYEVNGWEMITISDIAAAVLYRSENDDKFRLAYLPLVTMSCVEPIKAA
jgi:hypothetical protein